MTLRAQPVTSTPIPPEAIQSPKWGPAAVYGIVFSIVIVFLGIPGALVAVHTLQKRTYTKASGLSRDGLEDATEVVFNDIAEGQLWAGKKQDRGLSRRRTA